MFRSKDRMLKKRRIAKHKNDNKDRKISERNDSYPVDNGRKYKQLLLRKNYNIKIHMHELNAIIFDKVLNNLDNDNIIGNSNVKTVKQALSAIENDHIIPFDTYYNHDITKWSESKKKDKIRTARRQFKFETMLN